MPATVTPQEDVEPAKSRPVQPKRALISVSDKTQLVEFAQALARHDIELFSTGGTRATLADAGCDVTDVASYTGFPEMMDGRVKTLHPKIFGGILARRARDDDLQSLADHEIAAFDLVVVNLYPFETTIARPGVTEAEAIEQIDIGGPSLVRAAAKNFADVAVVTDPAQYARVLAELDDEAEHPGQTSLELRRQLAAEAFAHTAAYDQAIASYFVRGESFPETIGKAYQRQRALRYGENPHQRAAVYVTPGLTGSSLVTAEQLNGKELSYNNYLDLDAAWRIVRDFPQPAVSVIKHNNPCGASTDVSLSEALQKALDGDPTSAFGSVLGINRPVDRAAAEALAAPGLFIEAIIAPGFEAEALEILTTRPKWKQNVRLLAFGDSSGNDGALEIRPVDGGVLVQERDDR
ncbi:MAG: bifunctional phosphoribosylaminoimidazolecarboxamide formyltransferase/IMP cyclohydrolase, partial [Planctomycetota bacterium]